MKKPVILGAMVLGLSTAGAQVVTAPPAAMPAAHIYPEISAAATDIQAALRQAKKTRKRVILDFGGDWCGDCQVLNYYFHQPPNLQIIAQSYIIVPVNVGHIDANLEIGDKYGVPLKKGVPGLAVLRADGTVIYSQKNGEFEDFRNNKPSDLTAFLEKWKPAPPNAAK